MSQTSNQLPSDDSRLCELLKRFDLVELPKEFLRRAQFCLRGTTTRGESEQHSIGSKIGGLPDLPADFDWPNWREMPLFFVAQVELCSLRGMRGAAGLPKGGFLWFFRDAEQTAWGEEAADFGAWRVIYRDSNRKELARTPFPPELDGFVPYPECRVEWRESVSLPPTEELETEGFELSQGELDGLANLAHALIDEEVGGLRHQVLGYSLPIQNDMRPTCGAGLATVRERHSIDTDSVSFEERRRLAAPWRLLFQLDSDPNAEMMWIDAGCLYFWIRDDDLRQRRFDDCWMIMQSC
jgi:uncharacterized protein YwqG